MGKAIVKTLEKTTLANVGNNDDDNDYRNNNNKR